MQCLLVCDATRIVDPFFGYSLAEACNFHFLMRFIRLLAIGGHLVWKGRAIAVAKAVRLLTDCPSPSTLCGGDHRGRQLAIIIS